MRRIKADLFKNIMWRWIIIPTIIILVGAVTFAVVRLTYVQAELITSLQSNFELLSSQYAEFHEDYDTLHSKYEALASEYESLEADFKSFRSDYDTLQGRILELQNSYDNLKDDNEELRGLLNQYEKVPHSYYSIDKFPDYSNHYQELENFLSVDFTLPRDYEVGVFDCSESAAFLEWVLQNAGFITHIAIGPAPWERDSGYHAWVIVYTEEHKVAIEATAITGEYKMLGLFSGRTPGIVYSDDPLIPGWQHYYEGYEHLYKNIYEAIRSYRGTREWNWWEGYWGFE